MSCVILDKLETVDSAGVAVPRGGIVIAQPLHVPTSSFINSVWVEEQASRRAVADPSTGIWQHVLPTQAESDPSNQQWIVTLPSGLTYQGIVPSTGGPFTLKQLKDSHGWTLIAGAESEITFTGPATYVPATPGDWTTQPTTVQGALDMLAAALSPVP